MIVNIMRVETEDKGSQWEGVEMSKCSPIGVLNTESSIFASALS